MPQTGSGRSSDLLTLNLVVISWYCVEHMAATSFAMINIDLCHLSERLWFCELGGRWRHEDATWWRGEGSGAVSLRFVASCETLSNITF